MGDPRSNRIDETLQSLFESFVPSFGAGNDSSDLEFRIEQAIEEARQNVYNASGQIPSETNHAQDLIKRKLLRENASPEKAARFSNLYSRLLAIPVLSQKWSILYLLYKLAGDADVRDRPQTPPPQLNDSARVRHHKSVSRGTSQYSPVQASPDTQPGVSQQDERGFPTSPPLLKSLQRTSARENNNQRRSSLREDPIETSSTPRQDNRPTAPSELDLLRDLPFNLQGLSSTNLKFVSSLAIKLPPTLPVHLISVLHTLAEPCLLYSTLTDFTKSENESLINQSLRAAISDELRSYLSLVATLEGEIRRALAALQGGDSSRNVRVAGATLKRSVIWTRDATMGLRLMSLVVEEAQKKRGGQIISLIHAFSTSHGDPFIGSFAARLLDRVTRPFYEMMRHWIYDGELVDPHHEFFVIEPGQASRQDIDPRRVATSIWEDKYKLDADMVPSIISADFARKVFLIGKSLNFIRHSCGDADWVNQYSKSNSKSLDHANTATLSSSIDTAYASTMSRLTYLMSAKFGLFTHLAAIKKYLLLSQGDFIELLMESLAPNLDRPANSQYRHTLTSQLEHAIRHSNAQYDDPDVLRRLDARMLELSSGEIGWDCFTLEYKISAPCDVVITQWASTQYLKVFNLLWRVRRVEFSLGTTWRRCMTGSRSVLAAVEDKLGNDWKRTRCVIAEMVHFVNQLQYYILFEVVEASWEALQSAIQKPNATLDDLIEAHTKYINTITHKGLLGPQRAGLTGQREDSFLTQLHYILKCMLSYRDVADGLYSFSVAEYTKRQQFSAKVEQRTAQGKWGITEKDLLGSGAVDSRSSTPLPGTSATNTKGNRITSALLTDDKDSPLLLNPMSHLSVADDQSLLESLRSRLLVLSAEFRSRVNVLLYDLAHQPDVDMRFLGVVMNFNDFYKPVNVRRQQRKEREKKERELQSREVSVAPSAVSALSGSTAIVQGQQGKPHGGAG